MRVTEVCILILFLHCHKINSPSRWRKHVPRKCWYLPNCKSSNFRRQRFSQSWRAEHKTSLFLICFSYLNKIKKNFHESLLRAIKANCYGRYSFGSWVEVYFCEAQVLSTLSETHSEETTGTKIYKCLRVLDLGFQTSFSLTRTIPFNSCYEPSVWMLLFCTLTL